MDLHLRHEVDRVLTAGGSANANLANDLMVDYLMARGFVVSLALEEAMRSRPRHLFLPGSDLHTVYQDRALATAFSSDGWFDSSCSTPSVVSIMTEALDLQAGDRVLEIGAGTGWTAAVMAAMGESIRVTTLEVIPELAAATRVRLQRIAGDAVELRCADGSGGSAGPGPYEKIVFACGAAEIPDEIVDLLIEGGRLVIPVGHFIHVFDKVDGRLRGRPLAVATFIAFRAGEPTRRWQVVDRRAVLVADAFAGSAEALAGDLAESVPGPELDAGQIETLLFWLSMQEPEHHFLLADRDGGWGLGLVDQSGRSAAAIVCRGEFTFRHYRGYSEETRIDVWGSGEAGDRLLAICNEVAGLGWPRLEDLGVSIGEETTAATFRPVVGDRAWAVTVTEAEISAS